MKVECRQLIDDNAHRHILALTSVHARYQTIENKRIQCSDDALHLRVVGNEQIAGRLWVGDFQVEVIAVLVEYPVTLLCRQSRSIDAQRTDHTFQLLHCLVLQRRLERTEQRRNFVVGLQNLEDGLVALIEEREDMRHIGVFSEPVRRFGGRHALHRPARPTPAPRNHQPPPRPASRILILSSAAAAPDMRRRPVAKPASPQSE